MDSRKIIVLTPVKNEGWIIEQFIRVTSCFADHIIIANQHSSDNTVAICARLDNVTVVENNGKAYREDERQQLLIQTARAMFPGENLLLALDADEFVTASSLSQPIWDRLKMAPVGTAFFFEKPDLLPGLEKCIRHRNSFYPMGFIDDGSIVHDARAVHSIRIPVPGDALCEQVKDVLFLHYSYVRPAMQRAKFRFYAVQEAVNKTAPWYRRRRRYRKPNHLLPQENAELVNAEWFEYPDSVNWSKDFLESDIDIWYDKVLVQTIQEKGAFRFWLDDIWDGNWKPESVMAPPFVLRRLLELSDKFN